MDLYPQMEHACATPDGKVLNVISHRVSVKTPLVHRMGVASVGSVSATRALLEQGVAMSTAQLTAPPMASVLKTAPVDALLAFRVVIVPLFTVLIDATKMDFSLVNQSYVTVMTDSLEPLATK